MKSNIRKLEGTSRHLEIKLSSEAVEEAIKDALEDIRKTAVIPGFRKGNAPLDIINKNYRAEAVEEMKRKLISQACQRALGEHKIDPVSYPEISDIVLDEAGVLSFIVRVDAHPEIKLKKYKGLKVTGHKVSVTDKEVEEAILRVQNMCAEFTDTDRPVEKGDFAVCDVEAFMDDKSISKKNENMWIEADKDASLLGMGEKLYGLRKGDRKEVETILPEDYPDKKYAGKKAVFKVEVKETKEKKLPPVDDGLAKKIGKDTIDDAREELKSQILERKERDENIARKNQILEQLLKSHSFDLPASMVKRQLDVLVEKAENDLAQKGMDKEAIESHKGELRKQLATEAENKVRVYFILDAISTVENITVTEEEIDESLKVLAGSFNQPFEKVKEYYKEKDLIGGLGEQLREEKALEVLLAEANVVDK